MLAPLDLRERPMLGWAGLRGATPIWLATFPVVAGVGAGEELFSIVFFVVVTSTLVQGASFEPLAKRLGLTTDEPALPRRLLESGRIRRLGGDVVTYRVQPGAAAAGHLVRELGLPREALVNVIVRDGRAIPPRGSTEIREGDELHILVRSELREEVEELTEHWHDGPIGAPPPPRLPPRGAAAGIHGAPRARRRRGPLAPEPASAGSPVIADPAQPARAAQRSGRPRRRPLRRDRPRAWSRSAAARRWPAGASAAPKRGGDDPAERAWWQEVIGALVARG